MIRLRTSCEEKEEKQKNNFGVGGGISVTVPTHITFLTADSQPWERTLLNPPPLPHRQMPDECPRTGPRCLRARERQTPFAAAEVPDRKTPTPLCCWVTPSSLQIEHIVQQRTGPSQPRRPQTGVTAFRTVCETQRRAGKHNTKLFTQKHWEQNLHSTDLIEHDDTEYKPSRL